MANRTHTKQGRMTDACPGCCIDATGKVLGTAGFTATFDKTNFPHHTNAPMWECNNCSATIPRRNRRTQGEVAFAKWQSENPRTD